MVDTQEQSRAWYKEAAVYQIWPHSFADSNGDGVGDLQGAISKIDYLHELGIDVVWFSPLYTSPMDDMGYDISNYYEINPQYGTMEDWQMMCDKLKAKGMKLVMDLVVNHCSSESQLFIDSCNRVNGKDDWFIWRDAKMVDGKRTEPNNWLAAFRGSTWEWNDKRQQYYLHTFATTQPDFNWENKDVRAEVHKIMRFWMDKGAAGFRMDVINMISKHPDLPDAPITIPGSKYQPFNQLVFNGPHVHEYLQELYTEVYSKYETCFNVGETPCVSPADGLKYVAKSRNELQMIFQFEHVDVDMGPGGKFTPTNEPWKLSTLKAILNKWQVAMQEGDGWNSLYLSNHDQPRCVSRYGDDSPEWRDVSARMLALFLVCQAGTPYIYQGQELGMKNRSSWPIEDQRDLDSINYYNEVIAERAEKQQIPTEKVDMSDVLAEIQKKSRDNARTPVHWSAEKFAGFSTVEPWIAVMDDYPEYNAAAQVGNDGSHYEWTKEVLRFRKDNDVLIYGMFKSYDDAHEQIYAFTRTNGKREVLVLCNFSSEQVQWAVPAELSKAERKVLLSNYTSSASQQHGESVTLQPWEA
ncbi:glycoside hydrolase family 13 protein, partial [Protomyces lactucae-debilis]